MRTQLQLDVRTAGSFWLYVLIPNLPLGVMTSAFSPLFPRSPCLKVLGIFSPRTSPRRIDAGDSLEYSLAQRLPQDILYIIFTHLALPYYTAVFVLTDLLTPVHAPYFLTPKPSKHVKCLLAGAQTCKAWNIAGTEILYSKPCLLSHHQVRLFLRTMKENPTLGLLVRNTYFLQPPDKRHIFLQLRRGNHESVDSELATVLYGCSSLNTLSLTLRGESPLVFTAWHRFFNEGHSVGGRLRRLWISGDRSAQPTFADVIPFFASLPVLEDLVLEEVAIQSGNAFPHLPKLWRFMLLNPNRICDSSGSFTLPIDTEHFPSLKEFGVVGPNVQLLMDEPTVRRLRELSLLGEAEMRWFVKEVQRGHLENLQSLIFHIDTYRPGDFWFPRLPRCLQSMTLILNFSWKGKNHPSKIEVHALRDFSECLAQAARGCQGLKTVSIRCGTYKGQDTSSYEATIEDIRSICQTLGVTLKVRKYTKETYLDEAEGMVYYHLYS